jgi:hypothetical protein
MVGKGKMGYESSDTKRGYELRKMNKNDCSVLTATKNSIPTTKVLLYNILIQNNGFFRFIVEDNCSIDLFSITLCKLYVSRRCYKPIKV